jgi:hypothetical protein
MKLGTLHEHLKNSVSGVVSDRHSRGVRFLLESGGTEGFLRDLLAIELTTSGLCLIREYPTASCRVDLVLHKDNVYIEAKQLHLKDGARYVSNILRDLKRHLKNRCLGVVYVVDERSSRSKMQFERFGGANRRAVHGVLDVLAGLQRTFPHVYPSDVKRALLRRFTSDGYLDLYAFVVDASPARAKAPGADA